MPAGKEAVASRELDGKLYAGLETFEWLLAVISYVMAAEVGPEAAAHACAEAALAVTQLLAGKQQGLCRGRPVPADLLPQPRAVCKLLLLVCCAEEPQEGRVPVGADLAKGEGRPARQVNNWQVPCQAVPPGERCGTAAAAGTLHGAEPRQLPAQAAAHACVSLPDTASQAWHAIPVQDTWRTVTVDDRIPLDLFGGCFSSHAPAGRRAHCSTCRHTITSTHVSSIGKGSRTYGANRMAAT